MVDGLERWPRAKACDDQVSDASLGRVLHTNKSEECRQRGVISETAGERDYPSHSGANASSLIWMNPAKLVARENDYGAINVHVAVCDVPPEVTVTVPLTRVPLAGTGLIANVVTS